MKTTLILLCLFFVFCTNAQSPPIQPMKFCEVIQSSYDPKTDVLNNQQGQKAFVTLNVGTKFRLLYEDHNNTPFYAATPWDGNFNDVISIVAAVLEDLDPFLDLNLVDPSCGNTSQRLNINISPYLQYWVDNNLNQNALAVASQFVMNEDINYLSQGCSQIPVVQLMTNYYPYGDYGSLTIGHIYINPAISNFNLNYPTLPTGGEYDLYSVILHELTHILGINRLDFKFKDLLYSGATPLNAPGIFACADHPNFSALSTSTCTAVSFIGNYTNDPIYAPPVFEPGSSLSHFPDDCAGSPLGNNVMNPGISMGQVKRFYHQREINALQDLGFNFTNPFNGVNYTLNNTNYVVGNHDGLLVQSYPDEGFLCDGVTYTPIVHQICGSWPLNLTPLTNDINATFIKEAVVKTGNANATVTITGVNNDQLNFTATQPGVYTIGYLPASANRTGLPTYIQVYVPACDESFLDDLTCNDAPNCNQICFGNVYEHTLLAGNQFTFPTFYTDNSFEFGCNQQEIDQGTTYESSYSSVFFWVNTNPTEDYSISFKRSYNELGNTTMGNPHVKSYAYLVKSSDMITGQFNQSSNSFPSLPANKQLVYEELFTADSYALAPVSLCFTANDNYDMLLFYDEQINNFNYSRHGKVTVKNLEFIKKELPVLPAALSACLPEPLTLGEVFCAVGTNTFSWTSQNNTVLTTGQVYSQDNIISPIDDEYTFTMTYPSLPATVITPSGNASCNFSQSIPITFVECCAGATQPIIHPLTAVSTGRTFGMDVDGDNNGAVYYSGAMSPDVTFGSLTVSTVLQNSVEGFLVKLDDFCVNWLVKTAFQNSKIEVTDDGRVFYLGSNNLNYSYKYLAQFNAANGAVSWSWNTPGNVRITDFVVDEAAAKIIVTGRMPGSFTYNGTPINGSTDDIFVIRMNYGGGYIGHVVIPANGSFTESRVAVKNNNLFVAYTSAATQWKLTKLNYSTLAPLSSPVPSTIASSGNFIFNALEVDGANSNVIAQVIYTNSVTYNGSGLLNAPGTDTRTGYIKINPTTLAPLSASFISNIIFAYDLINGTDMDVSSGKAFFTYCNDQDEVHVKSINTTTGATIWDKITYSNNWVATKGVKSTPSGVFNTGCFVSNILVDNNNILSPNLNTTTFYGIKYNDGNGAITALGGNGIAESADQEVQFLELDDQNSNPIQLFPNPGKGFFTIKAEGNYHITVRDIHGKVVDQFEGTDQSNFDISERSNGLYLVEIVRENETQIFKLLKE